MLSIPHLSQSCVPGAACGGQVEPTFQWQGKGWGASIAGVQLTWLLRVTSSQWPPSTPLLEQVPTALSPSHLLSVIIITWPRPGPGGMFPCSDWIPHSAHRLLMAHPPLESLNQVNPTGWAGCFAEIQAVNMNSSQLPLLKMSCHFLYATV